MQPEDIGTTTEEIRQLARRCRLHWARQHVEECRDSSLDDIEHAFGALEDWLKDSDITYAEIGTNRSEIRYFAMLCVEAWKEHVRSLLGTSDIYRELLARYHIAYDEVGIDRHTFAALLATQQRLEHLPRFTRPDYTW